MWRQPQMLPAAECVLAALMLHRVGPERIASSKMKLHLKGPFTSQFLGRACW